MTRSKMAPRTSRHRVSTNSKPMDSNTGILPMEDDCPIWIDWVVRMVAVAAIGFAVWMMVA